jgi:SAM-dependent methyltransferase
MAQDLFDLTEEYEEMLQRGIRLSGESKEYFVQGRIGSLMERLPSRWTPKRILDYGCGIGGTSAHLAAVFSSANVVGVDTSEKALEHARSQYGSSRVTFVSLSDLSQCARFDLCYVNGVFHHIEPEQRGSALAAIRESLSPEGYLALFENNPWNPGTRAVMARIPFDRGARPLSPRCARKILTKNGFAVLQSWSLFYFPRILAMLRPLEASLSALPLGAQYCALATPM